MTMHAFVAGELLRDPERRTAGNGNPFVSDAGHLEEFCQG